MSRPTEVNETDMLIVLCYAFTATTVNSDITTHYEFGLRITYRIWQKCFWNGCQSFIRNSTENFVINNQVGHQRTIHMQGIIVPWIPWIISCIIVYSKAEKTSDNFLILMCFNKPIIGCDTCQS